MRWRVVVGLLLGLAAVGQAGVSGWIISQTRDVEVRAKQAWDKADDLCREALSGTGNVTEKGSLVEVRRTLETGEDWRVVLMDASSAISYCSTRQMLSFCMGKGCQAERSATEVTEGLGDQAVAPSMEKILEAQPIRLVFSMIEVRQ